MFVNRVSRSGKSSKSQEVIVWGTGTPLMEFLHASQMADACVYLMQNYDDGGFVNMGSGSEISISDLANMVKEIVGFQGKIIFDTSKPDGTPRKIMDVSRLNSLGWENLIALKQGIEKVYKENFL